jgi:hypothetical protein
VIGDGFMHIYARRQGQFEEKTMRTSAFALALLLGLISLPLSSQDLPPHIASIQDLPLAADEFDTGPGTPPNTLFFGAAVAVQDDTALVALPGYLDGVGRVAVFRRNGAGVWVRRASLNPADGLAANLFGQRIALEQRVALVGSETGVYVFQRRRDGAWQQTQKLLPREGELLGGALALADGFALIGTSRADEPGAVRVYWKDRRGVFHRGQKLIANDGTVGNEFGVQMAAAHDTLVVGAEGDLQSQGAAYVFKRFGPFWVQRQKLIAIDGAAGHQFGSAVAIGDGLIAVGASNADRLPFDGSCQLEPRGAVYVFARHGHLWFERQKAARPEGCLTRFGDFVAINAHWLVVSTPAVTRFDEALASLYERQSGSFALLDLDVFVGDTGVTPSALSGRTLLLGGPFDGSPFNIGGAEILRLKRTPP